MMRLKKQIQVKYFLYAATAFSGILLMLYFLVKPLFLGVVNKQVWETWRLVREQDFSYPEESEEEEWTEGLPQDVNVVVLDEDFTLLFGSNAYRHYGSQIRQMKREAEDFSFSPSVAVENGGMAPVSVRALVDTEQGKRYIYVYKYTNHLRDQLRFGFRCTAVCLALLFLISLFILDRLLENALLPGEHLLAEYDYLRAGDYSRQILERMPENEWKQMAEAVNYLAGLLYRYQTSIDNYVYLKKNQNQIIRNVEQGHKQMISGITHQLKTPLAIISSQVEMNQSETDPEKREYYCQSILEEIEKMSRLISGILQNSKPENTFMGAKLRRMNLSEHMEDLIPKYENWVQAHGIHLKTDITSEIYISADALMLEQAIHNYMMNAVEHTRRGKMICIRLEKLTECCRLSVHNDGNGIPESDLNNIWDGYYQGAEKNTEEDIGIGLYIVKDILRQHGGDCGVENDRTGVEFWIQLPLCTCFLKSGMV